KKIGIHDNFFEIGGHSLLAAKLVWKIKEAINKEVSLKDIFSYPTISELIKYPLKEASIEKVKRTELQPRKEKRKYPLTYAQKGIWFQDQIAKNKNVYNITLPVEIKGNLKISILEESITKLIERHETLRATFINQRGLPVQLVSESYQFKFNVEHLVKNDKEELVKKIHEEAFTEINLSEGPIFRANLLRISEELHVLIITIHHIVSDTISFKNLIDEIMTVYSNKIIGKSYKLPELNIQYADFAAWQEEWINSELYNKQLSYWENQLKEAPSYLSFPIELSRPAVQNFEGTAVQFKVSEDVSKKLRELAYKEGVTLYMLFMAAWNTLLFCYTGQKDIVIGTSASGRNPDTERLIGLFINTLPIRTKLAEDFTFLELLDNVKRTVLDAFSHQDVPFEVMLNALKVERNTSRSPLCQVFLSYHISTKEIKHETDLIFNPMPIKKQTVPYDIVVDVIDDLENINGRFEYRTALFSEKNIKNIINMYLELLNSIVKEPTAKIKEISCDVENSQRKKNDHR
ncbi:condensation domain-containing protein, partial [Bacillus cereus]|uniref:condensation domain-containing protein n=1 Tax=Bacillus cereus TaxID=1396 RepID=UPI001F337160